MGERVPMTSSRVSYGLPLQASIVSPGLKTPNSAQAMAWVPLKHCARTFAEAPHPDTEKTQAWTHDTKDQVKGGEVSTAFVVGLAQGAHAGREELGWLR